jgi:hypothetical protein
MVDLNERTAACTSMVTLAMDRHRFAEARAVFHELKAKVSVCYGDNDASLEARGAELRASAGRLEEPLRILDRVATPYDPHLRRWAALAREAAKRGRLGIATTAHWRRLSRAILYTDLERFQAVRVAYWMPAESTT